MGTEVTAAEIRIDAMVREYRDLSASIRVTEERKDFLKKEILEWMGDERELEIEGLPLLRKKDRSLGDFWDSDAIRYLIDHHPQEWRKLIELGCVQLNGKAIKQAIENNQLAGKPAGAIERRTDPFLEFQRER